MQCRRICLALLALALGLAAGCGTRSGGSATAQEPELTTANFASALADAQKGVRTAHIEADLTMMGERFAMAGDVDGDPRDLRLDFTLSGAAMGGEARMILVDEVLYLQIPGLTPGGRFFSLDIDRSNHPAARMFARLLDQVRRIEPSEAMKAFEATVGLRRVGTAATGGVETTRYDVTVDTRRALRAMGMDGLVPPRRLPRTLSYDLWLDAERLPRRMRTSILGTTVDMTFSRWGQPVDITAPPPAMTTPMPGVERLRDSATARG